MFDPSLARANLERMWARETAFGIERVAYPILIDQILGNRMHLIAGMRVLRDELELDPELGDTFSSPCVVTTVAFTNCGDRVHQSEISHVKQVIGSRFATISRIGELMPEAFFPPGGGTDDGGTLAHVTVAHELDEPLRKRIYAGHAGSYVLAAFDMKSHVGRDETSKGPVFGRVRESVAREPRAACGAIIGTLTSFDQNNNVHVRVRRDLGEDNFAFLRDRGVKSKEGIDITHLVAASIVVIRGVHATARALTNEFDERGLGHLTACVTVNRMEDDDHLVHLLRASVFQGEIRWQGFGLDATKYGGRIIKFKDEERLQLSYEGKENGFPISTEKYAMREAMPESDYFA